MPGPKIPTAELVAEFSTDSPPRVLGYHVVVNGHVVAMVTLEEMALAGLSAVDEVQAFELADPVKAGSLLFWHDDGMLHEDPGAEGTPVGMTMRDLEAGSVVRLFRDGFIPLDADLGAEATHQSVSV
jgi:hypothetical protein